VRALRAISVAVAMLLVTSGIVAAAEVASHHRIHASLADARLAAARVEEARLQRAKAQAEADGKQATLASVQADLTAAHARVEDLQRELGEKDAEIVDHEKASVSVKGIGRVRGTPDVMTVTIGVSLVRPTTRDALDAVNAIAGRVIASFKSSGVAPTDIQTAWLSVSAECRWNASTCEPNGYRASNAVEVKLRDLGRAGSVISAADDAGGNDAFLSGVSFDLEQNTKLLEDARTAAMASAHAKAAQYAQLAGRKLGKVLTVSEVVTDPPAFAAATTGASGASYAATSVPIEAGSRDAGVEVTVTYALIG